MKKVYTVYMKVIGIWKPVVEFTNMDDARMAVGELKKIHNTEYNIVEETLFDNIDEFVDAMNKYIVSDAV